ncbi:hypothetical protein J6590_064062 [Homalodisca vitripennis]|nr:hypothetical protein J6590_064062 [Homalodisca vitripennis]
MNIALNNAEEVTTGRTLTIVVSIFVELPSHSVRVNEGEIILTVLVNPGPVSYSLVSVLAPYLISIMAHLEIQNNSIFRLSFVRQHHRTNYAANSTISANSLQRYGNSVAEFVEFFQDSTTTLKTKIAGLQIGVEMN